MCDKFPLIFHQKTIKNTFKYAQILRILLYNYSMLCEELVRAGYTKYNVKIPLISMLCGKMSAPGRQLPVGRFYAARSRETGTAQTGATQICSSPSFLARASSLMRASLLMPARTGFLRARRCAVKFRIHKLSET